MKNHRINHRVSWLDTGRAFSAHDGETLLDAALRHGVPLPHDCTLGGCGTCRLRLQDGALHYDEPPFALDDESRAQGFGLACVGRVHGDITFAAAPPRPSPTLQAPRRLRAEVTGCAEPAPGVTRLRLALPPEQRVGWLPGQHLDLLLPDGRRRSFSMANAASGNAIELHVRHIEGGHFTSGALRALRPGDALDLELPLGQFHWRAEDDLPILMVATGTGIAPLAAMLDAMAAAGDAPPVTLYWGQRERRDFYLDGEIEARGAQLFEFRYLPVLSRPDAGWTGHRGHVQHAVLADQPDLSGHAIYLCGSPAMVRDATASFIAHGARPDRLYADSFLFQREPSIDRRPADEASPA